MKRTLKIKAENFAVADEDGSVIVSHKNNVQIIDVESIVKNNYDISGAQVYFVSEGPLPTIGINGSIIIVEPKGTLLQYFFPVGFESSYATCVSFNVDRTMLAVGVGMIALVYDLTKPLDKALIAVLEGHEANIIKSSFLVYEGFEHLLITCSEESRFFVWDLNRRCHCYESPFESKSLIKGVATFKTNQYFALAFEDGFSNLYDASPILNEKPSVKFIKTVNITRVELVGFEEEEEETIIISKNKPPKPLIPKDEPLAATTTGLPAILGIGTATMAGREFMLIATANSVISFNINTFEKTIVHTFDQEVERVSFFNLIVCGQTSFTKDLLIKRLSLGFVPELGVNLFTTEEPPEESPLNVEIQPKTKKTTPIATLHKNIKSSGYSSKPPGPPNRLAPKKPAGGKKPTDKKKDEAPIITEFKAPKACTLTAQPYTSPVLTGAMSPNGKRFLAADGSGTVVYVKFKASTLPAYLSHSQQVNGIGWDSSNRHFVTGSNDKTIKLWNIDRPDPLLTINTTRVPGKGTAFPDSITGASFLWQDKFVAATYGSSLSLIGYKLPNIQSKAVQDMHQTGTYKFVSTVSVDGSKIVSMTSSNIPKSPIVAVATTNKSVVAFDFYACQKAVEFETQHERPIHTVVANYGGIYTPRAEGTPSLLLTGAYDETFKLWDLRSARCERTIVGGSRTTKVGCCFSPDSRFVAIGTDRFGVEIWDVGAGALVQKLKDDFRGTAVTLLQWNPSNGKLYCGTEAGTVKVLT
jgi:WD40 repeat protein